MSLLRAPFRGQTGIQFSRGPQAGVCSLCSPSGPLDGTYAIIVAVTIVTALRSSL
jgi:hypothetical protein